MPLSTALCDSSGKHCQSRPESTETSSSRAREGGVLASRQQVQLLHSIPDFGITRPAIGLVQGASWQVSKRRNTFGSTDTSDGVGSQDYGVSPTTGVKLRSPEGAQRPRASSASTSELASAPTSHPTRRCFASLGQPYRMGGAEVEDDAPYACKPCRGATRSQTCFESHWIVLDRP
jgi:hypothetical protein